MADECIVPIEGRAALAEICGISILERLLRTLQRCGIKRVTILSSTPELYDNYASRQSWARAELDVRIKKSSGEVTTAEDIVGVSPGNARSVLVVRGDSIFDIRLLRLVLDQTRNGALVDSNVPPEIASLVASAPDTSRGKYCGAAFLERNWFASQSGSFEKALFKSLEQGGTVAIDVDDQPAYDVTIRRELRPFWFSASSATNEKAVRNFLLNSTQKSTLDIPALFHAPVEKFLTSQLCRTAITPNQLTIFCNIVAWGATILFATGHVAAGILVALMVGVLDGLDGKLARAKIETTKHGKLEHWFDAVFEWSWWTALAYYFRTSGLLPDAFNYWLLLVAAESLDGVAKGIAYFKTGMIIDEQNMFQRVVRLVGGRRNVYVWILAIGVLIRAPEKAFIAMVWLEVATAAAHLPQAAWIFFRHRKQLRQPYQASGLV